MSTLAKQFDLADKRAATALEGEFPIVQVSQVAEHESWRKEINRPLYHIRGKSAAILNRTQAEDGREPHAATRRTRSLLSIWH